MKTFAEFINENFNNDEHQKAIGKIFAKLNDIIETDKLTDLVIYPNGKIVSAEFDSKVSNLVIKDSKTKFIKLIIEVAATSEVDKNVSKVRFIKLSSSNIDDAFVYDYQKKKWYDSTGIENSWSNLFGRDLAK